MPRTDGQMVGISTYARGSRPRRKRRAESTEPEHGEGDERLVGAEGQAGEEAELGGRRLETRVREPVLEDVVDCDTVDAR